MEPIEYEVLFLHLWRMYKTASLANDLITLGQQTKSKLRQLKASVIIKREELLIPRLMGLLCFLSIWKYLQHGNAILLAEKDPKDHSMSPKDVTQLAGLVRIFDNELSLRTDSLSSAGFFASFAKTMEFMYLHYAAPEWDTLIEVLLKGKTKPAMLPILTESNDPKNGVLSYDLIRTEISDHFENRSLGHFFTAWVSLLSDSQLPAFLEREFSKEGKDEDGVFTGVYILSSMRDASRKLLATLQRRSRPDLTYFSFSLPVIGLPNDSTWLSSRTGRIISNYNRVGNFKNNMKDEDPYLAIEMQIALVATAAGWKAPATGVPVTLTAEQIKATGVEQTEVVESMTEVYNPKTKTIEYSLKGKRSKYSK